MDWAWAPAVELNVNIIRGLLTIDDGLADVRVDEVILGQHGLLNALTEKGRFSRADVPGFDRSMDRGYQRSQQLTRYTEIAQILYQVPFVRHWLDVQDPSPELLLLRQILRPHVSSVFPSSAEEEEYRRMVVVVEGAGTREVDGQYGYAKMHEGVGQFQKHAELNGTTIILYLYRCKMQTEQYFWYIGTLPDTHPGKNDLDFYACDSSTSLAERIPPSDGWKIIKGCHGLPPAPRITVIEDETEGYSSDRDDGQAVVEEDVLNEQFVALTLNAHGPSHDSLPFLSNAHRSPAHSDADVGADADTGS
jgi:hypothetical protein